MSTLPPLYTDALGQFTSTNNTPLSSLSDEQHLELAKEILSNFYASKDQWATAGNWTKEEAKLLQISGPASDFFNSMILYNIASLVGDYLSTVVEALELKLGKSKKQPELLAKKRNVVDDNGSVNEVYGPTPVSPFLPGNSFEVWTAPSDDQSTDDKSTDDSNKVAIVLGAGNQSFLSLIDILDNTLRHKRSVLLKHHPLRPWLSEMYAIILEPLTKRGYFAQVPDISNEATQGLLSDSSVGHVHVTGSYKTSQMIQQILQKSNPKVSSTQIRNMVTSELGCATPQVIDDGVYTDAELKHVAQLIAFGKKTNGGSNCLSAQVVVLSRNWAQKFDFRKKLVEELKRQPTTPCYYPGSTQRKSSILDKCPKDKCTTVEAASVSEDTKVSDDDQVVVVECGTPGEDGHNSTPLLEEAFGPILAIVELDHDNAEDDDSFLTKTAVPFLNNKDNIFGSLSCSIYTPVSKGKEYSTSKGFQSALATLEYGGIGVNQLNLLPYTTATKGGMWGGHKNETLGQSGTGNIGDLYGIIGDKVGKVVVYGPSLENKPMFDSANNPPNIVLDVLMELTCSPNAFTFMLRAFKLVVTRSAYGIISYIPGVGK